MDARARRRDFEPTRTPRGRWSRPQCLRALIIGLLLGLGPGLWLSSGWDHWRHPVLLGGLAGLSLCCLLSEVRFKRTAYFAIDDAVITLVLVVGGPLPAFLTLLIPDLVARLGFRRMRATSMGAWATYASFGWAMLAGAAVLALGHADAATVSAAPTLIVAGLAWTLVNWAIARGAFATLWQRMRLRTLLREEYLAMLPTQLCILVVAAALAMLVPALGLAVLYPLGAVVLIPQVLLPALAKSRDISRLDVPAATDIYVGALAVHLGARRSERRIAFAAGTLLHRAAAAAPDAPRSESGWVMPRSGVRLPPAPVGLSVPQRVAEEAWRVALHLTERWDGSGLPAGIGGRQIPKESRLIAVAAEWARLTAAGGPGLTQAEAMLALEAEAATRFDPRIVAAAGEIIATEAQFADLAAFQPKLGRIPLPRPIRSRLLPWALRAYAVQS